jgi:hypothetical protein
MKLLPAKRAEPTLREPHSNPNLDGPEKSAKNNREAYYAQIGGEAREPCYKCVASVKKTKNGPWNEVRQSVDYYLLSNSFKQCVTLDGYLKGSCANCHYGSKTSTCNFRQTGDMLKKGIVTEEKQAESNQSDLIGEQNVSKFV